MNAQLSHKLQPPTRHWHGSLALTFSTKNYKTVLTENRHHGPLLVQKPFYPESPAICHVYILHPPGGVVQGDKLDLQVNVEPGAQALITTPAAGKFYRSNGDIAALTQTLKVTDSALLEWLPQETLLFNNSQVHLKTHITLSTHARFIGWEMLCLGRKASAEPYTQGKCRQHFEVWRDGQPLFIERCQIEGQSPLLNEKWGMAGWPLTATMIATHCDTEQLNAVQALLSQQSINGHASVTLKEDLLICRFLGDQAEQARACFIEIWQLIRPVVMARDAHIPRIWNT